MGTCVKHMGGIIVALLVSSVVRVSVACAQTSYVDRMDWLLGDVFIAVDTASGSKDAVLDMVIRWKDRPSADRQHAVCIQPVLMSQDSSDQFGFAPIYIDGKIRSKAIAREEVLNRRAVHRPDSCFVIEVGKDAPLAVRYRSSLPYDRAMLDGSIVLYEVVHGCADCLEGMDTLVLSEVLPRYEPRFGPDFMVSPDGNEKRRERRFRADLAFMVNLSRIDPEYKDNAEALDGIVESIRTAMNDTVYTVRAVRFMGFASPEGPERFNTLLAGRRAASLADYIVETSRGMLPDSIIMVEGGAEDWDGFFAAVDGNQSVAGNRSVAAVRASLTADNRDSCERVLRADRNLFNVLRTDILPALRRTEYTIEYDVRDFSPEEAERLWQEHPEWLSINELYSVAELYGDDDPRYIEVLLAAARTYPADVAAVHNAAMALCRSGMSVEAVSLLSGRYEPGLLNTLGIIYAGEEMYDEALNAFRLAMDAGSEDAGRNLAELGQVLEQL